MIPTDARLLRLYVDASVRWEGRPLYRAIVEEARARHLAGASVFPVEYSLGARGRVHDAASEYAAYEMPVVVEIIDAPEQIASLMSALGPALRGVLATNEPVQVVQYRHHEDR